MPEKSDTPNPLLEILKDIEMPEPVSWWPPAPGWWILGIAVIVFVVWLIYRLVQRHRAGAGRREAIATLAACHTAFTQTGDAHGYVESVSQLLRRLCIQTQGRQAVARLTGDAWVDNLNRLSNSPLTDSAAAALGAGRYQQRHDIEVAQLHPQLVALVNGMSALGAREGEDKIEASINA